MTDPSTPPDPVRRVSADPFVDLVDAATAAAGRQERAATRARRERASDVATWVGTLRDLAERCAPVAVGSASGRTHRGALLGLGADHLVLEQPGGGAVALTLSAVRFVRSDPVGRRAPAMGDRPAPRGRTLLELLEGCLEDRAEVTVAPGGTQERLRGVVVALGEDVLTLRTGSEPSGLTYVPVAAVIEVVLPPGSRRADGG